MRNYRIESFNESNKWALNIQKKFAIPIYNSIWPNGEIIENDNQSHELAKKLDIGGVDKVISLNTGNTIHIAQRFRRPPREDFSLRYKRDTYKAEFFKLQDAIESFANYPKLYAFGVVRDDENGFKRFTLYDTKRLVLGIRDDEIEFSGPYDNWDGITSGIYIKQDNIPSNIVFRDFQLVNNSLKLSHQKEPTLNEFLRGD